MTYHSMEIPPRVFGLGWTCVPSKQRERLLREFHISNRSETHVSTWTQIYSKFQNKATSINKSFILLFTCVQLSFKLDIMGHLEKKSAPERKMCWESPPGTAGKGLKKVQLVLTSHSTHIAPEGGCCIYQASLNTHVHTAMYTQTATHAHAHSHTHTNAQRGLVRTHLHKDTHKHRGVSPNWLDHIHKPAQSLSDFFTSQLCSAFFWKGGSASLHTRSSRRLEENKTNVKTCKKYYADDARPHNSAGKSASLDCWV